MKSWTPDASEHFESWLGRVRLSVAGDPSLDPDDIAQDLRAHVHAELEAMPEPVTMGALDRVLDSLGNPTEWSDSIRTPPAAKAPWFTRNVTGVVNEWQKALAGEWGLPVVLGVLTLGSIPAFDAGGFVLLAFAYVIARSQVTYAPQSVTGRKRWLIYLPLAIGSGLLAGMVLGFPILIRGGGARVVPWSYTFEILWVLGSWWILVGILTAREPKRVQSALRPFADGFDASHGRFLALIGAAFMIFSSVILLAS